VEYPIKNRRDWRRYRDEQLNPNAAARYPDAAAWEAFKQTAAASDIPISIDGGSFYGFPRDWIGFEGLSYLLYDDPGLVAEMMDYLGDFFVEVLRRALVEVKIDFAMFWEDMCYKTGPLLSPAMFRKFMLPNYQKVTRCLAEHGVELSWVDCDGNIEALLPLWIEGGVRGFYPLEVAAGMDAVKLRQQYGREIVMWGGVDKRALAEGPAAIDRELARLVPIAAEGGFIPLVDHGVPDDVPYANYLYYLEQRKRLFGGP
jgi:uroporphyrinogen decarboxylase